MKITGLLCDVVVRVTTDEPEGNEYLRFSENNWWCWMGNSLEEVGFNCVELEAEYKEWMKWHHVVEPDGKRITLEEVLSTIREGYGAAVVAQHEDVARMEKAERELHQWKQAHETIRQERENSFEMLRKTVGHVGCTAAQPEVDLEINARIEQIIWERDQFLDPTPITLDWLLEIGFKEVPSRMGPEYRDDLMLRGIRIWEFNDTGEWLWTRGDELSLTTRGDLRMFVKIMRENLKE